MMNRKTLKIAAEYLTDTAKEKTFFLNDQDLQILDRSGVLAIYGPQAEQLQASSQQEIQKKILFENPQILETARKSFERHYGEGLDVSLYISLNRSHLQDWAMKNNLKIVSAPIYYGKAIVSEKELGIYIAVTAPMAN